MKKIVLIIACLGVIALQAQNPGVSNQDKEFTEWALRDNMAELKFSEMAMNKGFSPEVKDLARHMLADHKNADDLLRQLAAGRSIAIPTSISEEHEKEYKKLSDKEGEDFDKCFTEYVRDTHKKAIGNYEKEAKKGENTELRAFANNSLVGLNHHKNMADETSKKLKKK